MDRATATPQVDSFPGPNARRWLEYHRRHAAPSEHSHEFVWDITREAAGPFVTDVDGNVLLDFTCHIGAAPLGYNNPKLTERYAEFDLVDPLKIAGQDLYFGAGPTPEESDLPGASHLMDMLTDLTAQYGLDTVFLSNSGAESVENAMKIAYDHAPQPKYGVTFAESFHGRTLGTLSLTRSNDVYTRKYPEIASVRTVPFCDDRGCSAATCDCGFFTGDGSQLRGMLAPEGGHLDPDEVAYCVLEPIQGVGGYRFPSEEFMAEVGDVCTEYGITLVVDEIQSGVGRTGKFWASEHYDVEPDVICAAKALRVGATIADSDTFPEEKNRLGSTWGGGDLVSSMAGAFTIDAIHEHDLLDNAVRRGRAIQERLRDADLDPVVDVRGKGLMLAVEFDTPERRDRVVKEALERGMLTLGCGSKAIRLLPPLDLTEREVELGTDILSDAVRAAGEAKGQTTH